MDKGSPEGISVVICTYNGRSRISCAIESILAQEGINTLNWELIVIDNCSTDNTYEYCIGFFQAHPLQEKCRVIEEKRPGAANARTRSLTEAKYSWILFVDDDNRLFPDYLSKGWKILNENPGIGVLGGKGIAEFEGEEPEWFRSYAISFAVGPQAEFDGFIPKDRSRKLYSAGSFFKKDTLLELYSGGYNSIMIGPLGNSLSRGEDTEWCMLLEFKGYGLFYHSNLKFYHLMSNSRLTWKHYIDLKKGIASSAAKISSFNPFYLRVKPSLYFFSFNYFKAGIIQNMIWLKWYSLAKFKKSSLNSPESNLAYEVIKAKAKAYRKDFISTLLHFLQLKRITVTFINVG